MTARHTGPRARVRACPSTSNVEAVVRVVGLVDVVPFLGRGGPPQNRGRHRRGKQLGRQRPGRGRTLHPPRQLTPPLLRPPAVVQALEGAQRLSAGARAIVRMGSEQGPQELFEPSRLARPQIMHSVGVGEHREEALTPLLESGRDEPLQQLDTVGRRARQTHHVGLARERLERHHPHRVQVRGRREFLSPHLLGAHVGERPLGQPRLRLLSAPLPHPGDPEVQDPQLALKVDHQVVRLQVAVDQPELGVSLAREPVGIGQAVEDPGEHRDDGRDRERPFDRDVHQRRERLPLDVLHLHADGLSEDVVRDSVQLADADDVRVVQLREEVSLVDQGGRQLGLEGRQRGVDELDRDHLPEPEVPLDLAEVDRAERPLAQERQQPPGPMVCGSRTDRV